MKLSTRGRYGTLLMIELAKNYGKGPTSMSVVSRNRNISVKYLEHLIIPLKKGDLITSMRGPKGGHMLTRSPKSITLWDILLLLESRSSLVDCSCDESVCRNTKMCPVRPVWGEVLNAMMKVFKKTTLEDVLVSHSLE